MPWKWDAHVKTIVNPRKVLEYVSPHSAKYFLGFFSVDENGIRVDGNDNFVENVSRIRINHYFTKSRAEWIAKRNKGKADVAGLRPLDEFEWRDRNDVYDDTILQYRSWCAEHNTTQSGIAPKAIVAEEFIDLYGDLVTYPEASAWKNKISGLLLLWGIYRRELRRQSESVWQLELWKDVIFEAMTRALQSRDIDLYSLELVGSVYQDLMQDGDTVQENFKRLYLKIFQEVIKYYREHGNLDKERYFSESLQNLLCKSEGKS